MKLSNVKLAAVSAALSASSIATAHTGNHASVSGLHYLASPDHVVVFALLGVSAVALVLWQARRSSRATKEKK